MKSFLFTLGARRCSAVLFLSCAVAASSSAQIAIGLPNQRLLGQRHLDVTFGQARFDVFDGAPPRPDYRPDPDDYFGYRHRTNTALALNFAPFRHVDFGLGYVYGARHILFGEPDHSRGYHDLVFTAVAHAGGRDGLKPFGGLVLALRGSGGGLGVQWTRGPLVVSPGVTFVRRHSSLISGAEVLHYGVQVNHALTARFAIVVDVTYSDFLRRRTANWAVADDVVWSGRVGLRLKW